MKFKFDLPKTLTAVKNEIKKILWFLGLHAFRVILFLIFIDFILWGVVFYKYVFLAEIEQPKVTENIIKFDVKTYQQVLAELKAKEQSNNATSSEPATGSQSIFSSQP